MGRRGPKPKPSSLKLLRGNPGKRPVNKQEPQLPPASIVVPDSLQGRAREEWTRLCDALVKVGVLTAGDTSTFETYCRLVGDVDAYEREIARLGLENAHALGYANYLAKLRHQKKQYAETLGLTPSSRSGVSCAGRPSGNNPFAGLAV